MSSEPPKPKKVINIKNIKEVTTPNYIYVSSNRKVKLILVERDEVGNIIISGDIKSDSRPGYYHHARIVIGRNGCLKFSCSCEAGAHGFLCHHVMELYNTFRKNARKLLNSEILPQEGGVLNEQVA